MPVTTKIDTSAPLMKQRKYPYIGIEADPDYGDLIVLFDRCCGGTVLRARSTDSSSLAIGTYSKDWSEAKFAVLQLPVILENV